MRVNILQCFLLLYCICSPAKGWCANETADCWPGYVASSWFDEQTREIRFSPETRAIIVAPLPSRFDPDRPTLLIVYATPNGNSVEQALGCAAAKGLDWHFDIQHAAAQTRLYRETNISRNVVLVCIQADMQSWPAWRAKHKDSAANVKRIVDSLRLSLPADDVRVILTGHSGGGRFMFEYLNAVDEIPAAIERIAFLDANYGYSNELRHGEKILQWLNADPSHQFVVLAYDDRNIMLNGKKVVGPTGGTYRASYRMIDFLREQSKLVEDKLDVFDRFVAVDGRLTTLIHPNPGNQILHTRLVGEMNGLMYVLMLGKPAPKAWGRLGTPRVYGDWVQPQPYEPSGWQGVAPAVRPRAADAPGGSAVISLLDSSSRAAREQVILDEAARGNIPDFLRRPVDVTVRATTSDGATHTIVYRVMPDYFMLGSNDDFVRMPLTPCTAQHIADLFGCVLPTRKMVDDIYQQATVKLSPDPMTKDRESLATFSRHNELIRRQWQNRDPTQLVAGIKKDVVVSNKLTERPNRVAIYGWHKTDGSPIQPLTTVHVDWYVDYSHGIRLVDRWALVDDAPMLTRDVLQDEILCELLSDEGAIQQVGY